MSKFEGLGGTPVRKNKFEGLGGIPVQKNITQPQQEDEGYLATIGKSAVTGLSRFLDIPQAVGTLGEKYSKIYAKQVGKAALNSNIRQKFQEYADSPEVISPIKPVSQRIRDFAGGGEGNLDARPVGTGQRIVSDIADFGTALATNPFGYLGFAGKALTKPDIAKTALNSLRTGGLIGATTGSLKEIGVDPLAADIGASLAVPVGGVALNRAAGLSPNKLNTKAYEAAKELNIELPAATASRSKALDLAEQFVGKTPIGGDYLGGKYNAVGTKITEELEKVYDKVIPKAELAGVEDRISKLYFKAETAIPENGVIKPTNFVNRINEIDKKVGEGYFTSVDEKEVVNILDTIKKNMGADVESAPINKLIATKKALNNQITWDKTEGYRNLLKGVQRAINEDIKAYGKSSPDAQEWYNFYKKADTLFGQVKTREALERILTGKTTDFATETLKYGNLSKIIHDPKTRIEIKRLIGKTGSEAEKTLDKIDKIGEVAKAITIKNRNIPNPSGTANVAAITGFLGGMLYSPIGTVNTILGTAMLTNLVTNQKFLDNAYKAAVLKDKSALIRFEKQVKTITGSSVIDLSREFERNLDKPILTSEERKKQNELRAEERKKAAEKSKINTDKWIEEERKNSLIDLFDFSSQSKQNKTK